jgi:hypothetical protein
MSIDTDTPRDAVTWFEVRELLGRRALLEARLETGRTHQIRVHLDAVDLPVSGDPVYGVAGDLGLERQFLHAHGLRFAHPLSGETIDVSSPLPPDLEHALAQARADLPAGPVGSDSGVNVPSSRWGHASGGAAALARCRSCPPAVKRQNHMHRERG